MEEKFKILVVDDDVDLASNLQDILEAEGYTTKVAHDGQTALTLCREKAFDLAVVDIKLPDIPGLELINELAKISSGVVYIIITGYASLENAIEAVKTENIVAFETKPLDMDHLVPLIKQVAERKQVEEALRESEEQFRNLFENTHDIVQSIAFDGHFIFVNRAWLETLGYTEAELPVLNLFKIIHPESLSHCREMFSKVMDGESVSDIQVTFVAKDGRSVLVEGNATGRYLGGKRVATQGIFRDITERKQAEEALRESERKYRELADFLPQIVYETDERGNITFSNRHGFKSFNYSLEDIDKGLNALQMLIPEERDRASENIQRILNGEEVSGIEYMALRKDGSTFPVIIYSTPIIHENKPVGLRGIMIDITERKKEHEKLMLTDRLASVGELASGIAHEINNPLTSIIGFSELLLERDIADDIRDDLKTIVSEARRTAEIVKNLLIFARKHIPVKQLINVDNLINKVLQMRAYEQRVSNVQVITQFAPDMPEVVADYFQLQQVFLNIIINSEHFMIEAHNRGTLTITTERAGDIIKASFADDGPGISQENLRHLFDPFFTTKEVGKGTGLGLSICHGIMTEHGGRIYAESEPGKGATFVVELPIGEH